MKVEDEDDEALIYQSYRSKVIVGKKHPDPIVETASLASVDLPPPTYQHKLGSVANEGIISDAQLETIVYANMRFQQKIEGGKSLCSTDIDRESLYPFSILTMCE